MRFFGPYLCRNNKYYGDASNNYIFVGYEYVMVTWVDNRVTVIENLYRFILYYRISRSRSRSEYKLGFEKRNFKYI